MNTLKGLDAVGASLIQEGERLREVAAKYVEAAFLAASTAADSRCIRGSGFEACDLCGTIGEHICRAAAGLDPVKEVRVTAGAMLDPDPTLWQ